jgi:malonyl-CoA/methylmalonyl-CoA synthetase
MNRLLEQLTAGHDPHKTFIRLPDGHDVSYGVMHETTERFAARLAEAGVEPGDRLLVQTQKCWQSIPLFLATLHAGAVYVPLNPTYTEAELRYFVEDAAPRLAVCDPDLAYHMPPNVLVETLAADGGGTLYERAARAAPAPPPVAREGGHLAAILYTSGTTGRPKGAMLTHDNLASNASALVQEWRITEHDVLIHALPMFHTHGLFVAVSTVLTAGASMIFLPRFKTDEVLSWLPDATILMGVPTFYTRLLADPTLDRKCAKSIRVFISGSAPLLAETHASFSDRTGHAILERYGMTETNMNTSNPYEGERRPGTVGFPLPGVELRITDEDGRELEPGHVGMIELRGPNVCIGYWKKPEETAEAFREDGYFITGDLGMVDVSEYLHIVGRAKDLIISGGLNVYPIEIERELDQLDGVAESAVVGLSHPDFGEGVTAVVVPAAGPPEEQMLMEQLRNLLAPYKLPKRIVFLDELPRNAMGKVEKAALRARFDGLYD